ncbi:murein biosynthesis integral membrane protein MurJ [Candidatus Peregrinibacteria bacterium]|nr:murein biosynthesis integral membrane protein MurJ [Candidatus Peregrinibacteria bacterium]
MLSKIFKATGVRSAGFILMFASVLSYAAGMLRDRTLSHVFGATRLTDAYNAAFLIPDFLFNLFIAGALYTAFLPVYTSYLKEDVKEAEKIANTVLSFGAILLSVLGIIFVFLTPYLIPVIFSHVDAADHKLIIDMSQILLISPVIFCISNAIGTILMTHKHFIAYAFSGFFYNLGIIGGIFILHNQLGIYSAAVGAVIGALLHLLVRLLNLLVLPHKIKFNLALKHPGIIKIFVLIIPKTINLMTTQAYLWAYTIVGYTLAEGSIAAFNYARNLQSFPVSLFGIAFATAAFPFLSDHAHGNDEKSFSREFQTALEKILFFTIPATVGMLLLNREIVEIILKGGIFDQAAVTLTASCLLLFVISIPLESSVHLFARGFYAYKNTLTPMYIAIISTAVNIAVCVFAAKSIGVQAIGLAFLAGAFIQLLLLAIFIIKKLNYFNLKMFGYKMLKILSASCIMGAAVYMTPLILPQMNFLTAQIIRVIVGTLIFFMLAYLMRCPEIKFITLKRSGPPDTTS